MKKKSKVVVRKNKYQTNVEPKLFEIECWSRDGLIDVQIAKNVGVAYSTFREYVKKHSALSAALKKGKEIVDYEVENSLLKRALGYRYEEVTQESVLNPLTGIFEMKPVKIITKEVHPDTTAQIFWLKNRKPKAWRDKQEIEHTGETTHNVNTKQDLSMLTVEELKNLETILSKTADTD